MKFVTALPDDYYFTWQLEIQLYNFNRLGIAKEDIHVIIGYNKKIGLQHFFEDLIDKYKDFACFFIYPDNRISQHYPSSIRPHIMQQHVIRYSFMEHEVIFYYDTDVIFRELPDFNEMIEGRTWYVSDTRNYLDSRYIIDASDDILFNKMCVIVGIDPNFVKCNDVNCGGAQYMIKNAPLAYWQKVEKDCENLYELMESYNCNRAEKEYIESRRKRSECSNIQSWCADMWAVLWNAWLYGFEVIIHEELDFCWPTDSIDCWQNKKILHFSGIIAKGNTQFFRKSDYAKFPPFYDSNLQKIRPDNCSYPLARLIESYRSEIDNYRINLKDITFIFPVRIDSTSRLENLLCVIGYLDKYFNTNIFIFESDNSRKVNVELLPECCSYFFSQDISEFFFHTRITNRLIEKSSTDFIAIFDTDIIIPVKQILQSVEVLRVKNADMVYPYDGTFISVDSLVKEMFSKILDDGLLYQNINKFVVNSRRSFGGAVFVHRLKYVFAGMDNENFVSWGPVDIERQKRMKRLGFVIKRIEGPIFHLPHKRLNNSFYQSNKVRIKLMSEYLKICRMSRSDLIKYIDTWQWKVNFKYVLDDDFIKGN